MSIQLRNMCGKARLILNDKGQGLVEYALILVLIAIVVMAGVTGVGNKTSAVFSKIDVGLNK